MNPEDKLAIEIMGIVLFPVGCVIACCIGRLVFFYLAWAWSICVEILTDPRFP